MRLGEALWGGARGAARARARRRRALALALALVAVAPAFSGCVEISPAHVPDAFLRNGWKADPDHTDAEPTSSAFGTTLVQRVSYEDEAADDRGYPGFITVITARTLVTPNEESLRDQVQTQVRDLAEAQGIRLDAEAQRGSRVMANKAESLYFVYNGTVTQSSGLFTQNARTKVMGEVFQCRAERTAVVSIALVQITNTRSLGGVAFPSDNDPATWREVAADSQGTIEGIRGTNGLLWNVACS